MLHQFNFSAWELQDISAQRWIRRGLELRSREELSLSRINSNSTQYTRREGRASRGISSTWTTGRPREPWGDTSHSRRGREGGPEWAECRVKCSMTVPADNKMFLSSDAEYHEPKVSSTKESYFYGGGVEMEEEDEFVSPPVSGSGRGSPAPAPPDRKRDKVNRNGCREYLHNECCWLLWRYKINDAIITTYCYYTHT